MSQVRKAVILAAGYGTRLLPATKAQPKEMLPLVDKPVIQFAVEEAVSAGIEQITIVTALGKRAVEDYFDRSRDIEDLLREKGDTERLEEILRIPEMADFAYVRQGEAKGLGHAVLCARHVVGNEPFILYLPDDVILGEPSASRELLDCYERFGKAVVAVEEVPEAQVSSYGIVAGEAVDERTTRLHRLIEKPQPTETDSRLAIVGRYLLMPSVFDEIERTSAGYGGEIQITDALQKLADTEGMYAYRFSGQRFDTGRPLGLLKASIYEALHRADIGPALREYIRELDLEESA
jgi:UTP--glucose-1-phosphate uridylyltransferase